MGSLTTGGDPIAGMTRFLWVMVEMIRLLQLVTMGVFVFAVVRGIVKKVRQ